MGHYLRIHDDWDEIRLALVCTAAPGSPCRLRPADGREDWTYADADLIDSGVCWAVEWADEGGCVTSGAAEGVTWPLVPDQRIAEAGDSGYDRALYIDGDVIRRGLRRRPGRGPLRRTRARHRPRPGCHAGGRRVVSVAARWPNTCSECGERWHGLRPGETVCTGCWLVHPDGACDR